MSENVDLQGNSPDLPRFSDVANQLAAPLPVPASETVKRRPGAPKGNQNARKHGLRTRNFRAFDRRKGADRRALETVAAIERALGEKRATPQRLLILANVARRLRDLAKVDGYLARTGEFIGKSKGMPTPTPLVEYRLRLLESIDRAMERIGLDAGAPARATLADVVASFSAVDTDDDGSSDPGDESSGGAAPAVPPAA